MQVSFIEPHLDVTGGIRRITELSNALTDMGHDVTIYHPAGTPHSWLPCKAKCRKLDMASRDRHDVVIYNTPRLQDVVNKLADRVQRSIIYYVIGLEYMWRGERMNVYETWLTDHKKVAASHYLARVVQRTTGQTIPVIHRGLHQDIFHPSAQKKIPNSMITILRWTAFKGDALVIAAYREAKKLMPSLKLRGISSHRKGTLPPNTDFINGLDQRALAEAYATSSILVYLPSCEGFTNPPLEAMACGTPVVVSHCGGEEDICTHGKTALVVNRSDSVQVAAAIVMLLRDEALYKKMRENGLQLVQQFTWQAAAKKLADLF